MFTSAADTELQRPMGAISFRVCAFALEIRGHAALCCTLQAPSCKRWNNDVLRRAEPVRAAQSPGSSGKASIIAALDGILTSVLMVRCRQTDELRLRRVSKESGAKRVHKQRAC